MKCYNRRCPVENGDRLNDNLSRDNISLPDKSTQSQWSLIEINFNTPYLNSQLGNHIQEVLSTNVETFTTLKTHHYWNVVLTVTVV